MGILRGFVLAIVAGLFSACYSQGQQGGLGGGGFGGGGGGFGGGFAGGSNGDQDLSIRRAIFPGKRSETSELSNWTSKSIILTPSDKVEWKFSAKKGQVIFATAESETFDPAIAILDPEGKVIGENDDQYEGEQSPFVSSVIKQDGEYKLVVRNYRSTSGGRFTLYTKIAPCLTVAPGNNLLELDKESSAQNNQFFTSIEVEKGKYYGFLIAPRIFKEGTVSVYFDKLIGPSGVPELDQSELKSLNENLVFEAKKTGTYLVRCNFYSEKFEKARTFGVCFNRIDVDKLSLDGEATVNLLPGRQKILQFDVKVGTALRSQIIRPNGFADQLNFPKPQQVNASNAGGIIWVPLKTNDGSNGVRFFPTEGTVNYVICNFGAEPGTFRMENSTKFPVLSIGSKIADKLTIGEAKMYTISGSSMDIQRIVASSSQMEVTMDLVQDDMKQWSFVDNQNHKPSILLKYDEPHNFILTVSSLGRGGSGEYSLDFSKIQPIAAKVGTPILIQNPEGYSAVYEVLFEQDTQYMIIRKGTGEGISISDPDGKDVATNGLTYGPGGTKFLWVRKGGVYRMTFPGATNGSKVKIEKFVVPKID